MDGNPDAAPAADPAAERPDERLIETRFKLLGINAAAAGPDGAQVCLSDTFGKLAQL